MIDTKIPHPAIASQEKWLALRLELLDHEKEITRLRDRVVAERRMLPMVKIEKEYSFEGPAGKMSLLDLFEGQRQLIVYHFMFEPDSDTGCPGCTWYVNSLGDLSMLNRRDTSMVLVSRAPLPKLQAAKARNGWKLPWYSSWGSEFNYDYNVTHDERIAPIEYNYSNKEQLQARRGPGPIEGEDHGLSVFFSMGGDVFHAYSTYGRGVEGLTDANYLLDTTPYGRQEDWEDSPIGWPQKPTYG
jgi:predicted dithiol-disulfide oxidoreductase (DUF899 family)